MSKSIVEDTHSISWKSCRPIPMPFTHPVERTRQNDVQPSPTHSFVDLPTIFVATRVIRCIGAKL